MRYYKQVSNGYIVSVGIGNTGVEITKDEYDKIREVVKSSPEDNDKFNYRLKENLSWDSFIPEIVKDPETSDEKVERVTKAIEKLRDASVLPTTKTIYQSILDLFEGGD